METQGLDGFSCMILKTYPILKSLPFHWKVIAQSFMWSEKQNTHQFQHKISHAMRIAVVFKCVKILKCMTILGSNTNAKFLFCYLGIMHPTMVHCLFATTVLLLWHFKHQLILSQPVKTWYPVNIQNTPCDQKKIK